MGLFSFLNKNKQEAADEDSSYVARDDDAAAGARARSKRASSAGEPAARRGKEGRAADPVLPEKKRARRRLVGAIALALAVAVGLPMILDSEPKPLATDIDIRIPAKDKAPPQPLPAPVVTAETLDKSETIVPPPNSYVPPPAPVPAPVPAARDVAEVRPATVKPEVKTEVKPEAKPEAKPAKPEPKPAVQPDSERAIAILEDKAVEKAPSNQKFVVQVAALASQDKANELQAKLKAAGVPSFTQKGAGELIRVRVGPFSKEEGEKIRPKLVKLGLSGNVVPH